MNLTNWVTEVAETFGYHIKPEQLRIYVNNLEALGLTEAEWESLARQVRQEVERFPSLAQLWAMGNSMRRTKNAVEPRWRTWTDKRTGRCYAQKLSGYQAVVPTDADLERWRREAVPCPEDLKHLFFNVAKSFDDEDIEVPF